MDPYRSVRAPSGLPGRANVQTEIYSGREVTRLILEPNVYIVTGFHHLLARLRVARLIAVDRRDRPKPGQKGDKCDQAEEDDNASSGPGGGANQGFEPMNKAAR